MQIDLVRRDITLRMRMDYVGTFDPMNYYVHRN